jgi:uncharacterized protein (DUF849 family)
MKKTNKVVISCAITGAIHTPTLSPYLPYKPQDIAQQAIDAAKAGASIVHLHARMPEDGFPTGDPAVFQQFLPMIKAGSDAVINITTGGSLIMSLEMRLAAALRFKPEMCSLNMGSMNFSMHRLAAKVKEWKFPWEREYILKSEGNIFRNTFTDVTTIVRQLDEHGIRYELECYDVGHLYNLAYFVDQKLIKPPFFIQTIFGILGGIGPDPDNVLFMRRTADRLFGDDYVWSVLAAGRHQFPLTTQGAMMGGNVRVGLEDNLYLDKGQLAKSNAELVSKACSILKQLSLEVATPDETRAILELKGKNAVDF